MDLQALFRSIHLGIKTAYTLFAEWTGGDSLQDYGVEGFAVSKIAEAIMDPKNTNIPGFLTLETSFKELYESSIRPIGRKGRAGSERNRIDIALYHKNNTLSHVIEVKRSKYDKCYFDLDRLCNLYKKCGKKNGGPLKQAIFVQLVEVGIKRNRARIETHFKELKDNYENYIFRQDLSCKPSIGTKYYPPIFNEDGSRAFSSFCLGICAKDACNP